MSRVCQTSNKQIVKEYADGTALVFNISNGHIDVFRRGRYVVTVLSIESIESFIGTDDFYCNLYERKPPLVRGIHIP